MEGLNKFQVITVIIIFLFVFTVGAIYINTKDVTTGKIQVQTSEEREQFRNDIKSDIKSFEQNNLSTSDLAVQIENLNKRIDELSEKTSSERASSRLNCRVYGAVTGNGIEALSAEAAIEEAKNNDKELVLTCSF